MSQKKHVVSLSAEERAALEQVSCSNRRSEREKKRARILLLCDANQSREEGGSQSDEEVAKHLRCSSATVYRVRARAGARGAVEVVRRQEQHKRKERKLDGAGEATLVAVTCSAPPEGVARWSLRLLRERLIEMEVVENIGMETVRQTLKKTASSRG